METIFKKKRIGEILIEKGMIKESDLDKVLLEIDNSDKRYLGLQLIERKLITEEELAMALAMQFDLEYFPLTGFRIDQRFFRTIPVELMYRYPFIPYEERDGVFIIVLSDPGNLLFIDELELILKKDFKIGVSTRPAILEALKRSEGSTQVLKKIETEFMPELIKEDEKGDEVLSIESISRDSSPVIKLVDTIILNAIQKRASDIHIETTEKDVSIRYRVDGVLFKAMEPMDIKFHDPLISRIKVMSELDIAERRVPQDGRFKLRLDQKKVDFRVSILPGAFGEDIVIRILDKEYITAGIAELRLDRLGFDPDDIKRFRKSIVEPYGMVLVTGPTGSGKTTTLYAAISEINHYEDKIITIEDPVEYQLKDVVQIPVNEKKGITFARGLRSILRHDPDKILVGEIRDSETAYIAIQSALTGHLVFTTVHANNAFDVIGRFVNMGIEPYNFVSSLNCILAQRLVRTICMSCKEEVKITKEICEGSGLNYEEVRDTPIYNGKGCSECNGIGYKGRKAITEFLDLSDRIKEMILDRKPSSEIRKAAIQEGMITLRQSAMKKVFNGETTFREINRVTFVE
ncbi:MAG: GspE/PulE family protein [Nitrospirota bacterium]